MNYPIVIDDKKIYDPDEIRGIGFTYKGVGAVNY